MVQKNKKLFLKIIYKIVPLSLNFYVRKNSNIKQ